MKKLFLIITLILTTLFTSCTKVVYVDKDTNEVVQKLNEKDFIKLEEIANNIYVDKYTDVLYHKCVGVYVYDLTPIMKADGTCLTYTEWKERNK